MKKPPIDLLRPSPNKGGKMDGVDALVIHCTMMELTPTLEKLTDATSGVSCHYVIGENGDIYELIGADSLKPNIAWHAGVSRCDADGVRLENLNRCSIGVELVNLNGNLFPYPPAQYKALFALIFFLQTVHVKLKSATSIFGHEHVAGFRGKSDPGVLFDWAFLYNRVFPGIAKHPARPFAIPPDMLSLLRECKPLIVKNPALSGYVSMFCEKAQHYYYDAHS